MNSNLATNGNQIAVSSDFDPRSSTVKSVIGCRLSGVNICCDIYVIVI